MLAGTQAGGELPAAALGKIHGMRLVVLSYHAWLKSWAMLDQYC